MTLTHFTASGEAQMVDIGDKPATRRTAVVSGNITMLPETLTLIQRGDHKKGDVLGIARIAGIMASKRTADLVPLCHPIPLTKVVIDFHDLDNGIECRARCETTAATGVEMEALVACQIALATIYDMCKAVDRGMVISAVQLEQKHGGKSGTWQRDTTLEPTLESC